MPRTDEPEGRPTEVLIAGAGPTGLTLAILLARHGIPFRLIDAEAGPRPGSRGKGVQPRTLEVFEDLGIADRILASGRMAMPMISRAPDGRVRRGGEVPASLADRPDIPYPASLIIPQWRVEDVLRARLEELGGHVEFGVRLEALEQRSDGVLADVTTASARETLAARWVVGADGGHSRVRRQAGIAFPGETREDVRMVLADLPVMGLGRDAWETWRHPVGALSLCPLPSTDLFQYAASLAPGEEAGVELADLQRTLEQRSGRSDLRLGAPRWTSVWRANARLAERYRAGRVLLAGDAAHIHPPAGGQGMNTGIQDAHNLGWKLAAVIADGAPEGLLDTFGTERRPVAVHVLELSGARLSEALRTTALRVDRDASTIQLDIGYRDSALSVDDRDDRDDDDDRCALRAGDRAPDATGLLTTGGERRLFDLIGGGRCTVLDFGPADDAERPPLGARVLRVLPRPCGEGVSAGAADDGEIIDASGTLASAYGPTERTLVLIRPDGYIGLISDAGDRDAVHRYLDALRG